MVEAPLRVLVVTTVPRTIRAFLLGQLDAMVKRGWGVTVVSGDGVEHAVSGHAVNAVEVPFSRRPRNLLSHIRALSALIATIRDRRPDVIYTHTPIASVLVRLAVALTPIRRRPGVVYFAHGFHFSLPAERSIFQWAWYSLERWLSRWTDLIVVLNRDDKSSISRWPLAISGGVRYIPGIGIDPQIFDPELFHADRDAKRRWEVVCIAALNENKRHLLLLEAVAQIDNLFLTIIGDGEAEAPIRQRAEQLKLGGRVRFAGWLDDVRAAIAHADVVALASRREGLPRSLMESLCMGTPIAVTPTRGARDLAMATGCPIAADATPESLAEALRTALSDDRAPKEIRERFLAAWGNGLEPAVTAQVISAIESVVPHRSLLRR